MEAGTVTAPAAQPPQHMVALAKAMRRKQEVAQLKREVKAGRLSAAAALNDPRAVGAVTVGTILIAQCTWGRKRTTRFLSRIGATSSVLDKRVEDLTSRQRAILVRALLDPHESLNLRGEW